MMRPFSDQDHAQHTLDLDAVLVDGVQCVSVQVTDQFVQFGTVQGVTITCELGQFWHEVAGPDLSPQEAGWVLADCLVRQVVLRRMSASVHEAMSLLTRATAWPSEIPSAQWLTTRLDPLSKQAMSVYDGSPEMTEVLARILQREPGTIRAWAQQLGLDASAPDIKVATEPPPAVETLAEAEARERFHWSPERCQQLEEALKTCAASTVAEHARQIAAKCDWPIAAVQSKLYEMQRPRRAEKAATREPEHSETAKEGDQRVELREAISI